MDQREADNFRVERLARIGKPSQQGEMMKLPLRIANEINQLADTYDATRAANLFEHLYVMERGRSRRFLSRIVDAGFTPLEALQAASEDVNIRSLDAAVVARRKPHKIARM